MADGVVCGEGTIDDRTDLAASVAKLVNSMTVHSGLADIDAVTGRS